MPQQAHYVQWLKFVYQIDIYWPIIRFHMPYTYLNLMTSSPNKSDHS